jgi:hypothetical protein
LQSDEEAFEGDEKIGAPMTREDIPHNNHLPPRVTQREADGGYPQPSPFAEADADELMAYVAELPGPSENELQRDEIANGSQSKEFIE